MKKRVVLPFLFASSLLIFSGCGKEESKTAKPLKEITAEVIDCGIEFPEMVEVEEGNFQIKYGLAEGDYEEFSVWWAGSGADADEVCIIKAADVEKVKSAVTERCEGQMEVFKDYVPEQYNKLCDTEITTKGDYVYWLCTNDNIKAEDVIEKSFN